MDPEINLHNWQKEAANSWEQNGNIGVVNAVTGTGKTFLPLNAVDSFRTTQCNR